ncbi:hypothetical protein F4604DRAFT_1687775 [Suillus subluteus]|nr:hypothetical protein F4604DRAFT_1687775 [Suillus subluteus]
MPSNILPRLLPPDDISVADLINFRLPEIGKWPFSEKITFQEDMVRCEFFLRAEIPPEPYVEELRKNVGQAILDGKISMRDPRTTNDRLPLWVIEFWWALHRVHSSKMEWSEGKNWIRKKQEAGYHQRVFRNIERQLNILPWNKLLHGPAAGVGRSTKHLLRFLSDDEWLSDALVDMMTAHLASHLSTNQQYDTIIADTSFSDAIRSAKDISYHNQPHDYLQKFEWRPCRRLYAPMYTKNHYVAFEINFHTRSFRWGDSLDFKQPALEHLVEKLQWWFRERFGGEFRNDGPNLPHGQQKDLVSCALFAINTIEHNIFGHTLGIANLTQERARWFFLASESQICEPAVPAGVHASNEQAGPSHATHSNINALPPGQRALKQLARACTISIRKQAKVFIKKPKLRQEKVQQEQAEMEAIEGEMLKCKRIAHEKAEAERMECERTARDMAEAERMELEPVEELTYPDEFLTPCLVRPSQHKKSPGPAPSSLVPAASSQPSPLANTSIAGFNRMSHTAADTTKTRWFMERLEQFDIPHTVDLEFIRHPDYPSLRVVSRGRLVVSKRTEVRLRLWRAQYPGVPLWYLGIRCLSRGLDWQVFVPVPRLAAPTPRPAHLNDQRPSLCWEGGVFREYETRVRAMLDLPFARRFLSMGGIAWRIALHYGPESLFAAALSGPSTDAYLHGHASRIGGDIDDVVTNDDIALLLGTAGCSSLWPPPDVFEKYQKWQGEWSHEWEAWFQKRLRGIQNHDRSLFLNRLNWIKHRRRYTTNEYYNPARVGSDGHAAGLCTQADLLYPPMESYAALI